jgi:hypothetical protein
MLQNGLANLQNGITAALDRGGADLVDYARGIVPIRTGFLRSSIGYTVTGTDLEFIAAANYAAYVEYGTRYMTEEPYMRPAVDFCLPKITDDLAASVANAFQA